MNTFELTVLALKITCVPAAALASHLILRRRSAAARHLVLALGLAGVILVPILAFGVPTWQLEVLPPANPLDEPAKPSVVSKSLGRIDLEPSVVSGTLEFFEPAAGAPVDAAGSILGAREALFAIWMLGAAVLLAQVAAGLLRLRWIARRGSPVRDPGVLEQLDSCCRLAGLRSVPDLISTRHVDVPVVWGWLRPSLLVPAQFESWAPERRQMVLLHELGHLRRSDWPVLLLGRLVTSLYWFHPLVWSLERRARRECERACDDLVVRCGMKPSDYAQHLLAIASGLAGRDRARTALAVLRPHGIKDRLHSILNPGARRGAPGRATVILAGLGLVALLLPLASVELSSAVHASPNPEKSEAAEPVVEQHCEETATQHFEVEGLAEALEDLDLDAVDVDVADLADLEEGLMWVKDAVRRAWNPEEAEGERFFEKAYEAHREERWADAIENFEKAIELGYRPSTATYNVACGYARMGDKSKALEWLERASAAGFDSLEYIDQDSDLDSLRSDARFQRLVDRLYDEAGRERDAEDDPYRETLERAEALQRDGSTDAEAWYEVGVRLLQMRELPAAIKALSAAVEHADGDFPNGMYNLACAHSLAGNEAEALRWLERAVATGFDSHERFVNDTDLENVRKSSGFKRVSDMSEALSMESFSQRSWERSDYSVRRWAPAVERYTGFVAEHPEMGRGWFNLGYALHYSERFDEAIDALKKAESLGYRQATSAYNMACAHAKLGRTEAALEALERAMQHGFDGLWYLEEDEDLDSLRSTPRFERMREELARKHEEAEKEHDLEHKIKHKLERLKLLRVPDEGTSDGKQRVRV